VIYLSLSQQQVASRLFLQSASAMLNDKSHHDQSGARFLRCDVWTRSREWTRKWCKFLA